METIIKKIVIGIMCGVMILSGTSCLFTPSAREQAKYKEQRKQELDKIPIEDSRYKIVSLEEGEELPDGMVREYPMYSWFFYTNDVDVNGCIYSYTLDKNENEKDGGEYTFTISRDGGEEKTVMLDYRDEFKNFYKVSMIYFYEGLIFLVRGGVESTGRWSYRMQEILPRILFIYNYETNELKYAGYGEDWISSKTDVFTYWTQKQVIKHREENENK